MFKMKLLENSKKFQMNITVILDLEFLKQGRNNRENYEKIEIY